MSDWISVKDKLPENTDWIFIYSPEPYPGEEPQVQMAWFADGEFRTPTDEVGYYTADNVTHWQIIPVPEPPKESKK